MSMKVRVYAHVGQLTGYGKAAEGMCRALLAAGTELEIRPLAPYDQLRFDQDSPLVRCIRRDAEMTHPDVVIVHTLPLDCARVVELANLADLDVPLVAYTTWEGTSRWPVSLQVVMADFDRVWAPSKAGAGLMQVPTCITQVMPHAFDPDSLTARRAPKNPAYDDGRWKFYYVGAWTSRKYPEGVIRAYVRAFGKDDPVTLVIRSLHAQEDAFAAAWHRTGLATASPRIIFGGKPVTDAAMIALHNDCDCFVTASRGEGWNLPAFEAVLAQRHVISPRGLGSDEFLHETSATLYDGYQQPAGVDVTVIGGDDKALKLEVVGAQGQDVRTDWQEPCLDQLATAMRDAYEDKRRDLEIRYDLVGRFGYAAVGHLARTYLEELR